MWRLAAAKYAVTNAAIRATDEALRVAGSAGLAATSPLQRYFRDARTAIGQPPIEDVALTTIGKAALGVGGGRFGEGEKGGRFAQGGMREKRRTTSPRFL